MDLLHGGGEVQRPESYESVAPREERGAEGSDSWQERADTSSELTGVYGACLHELMGSAQDIPEQPRLRIIYAQRPEAGPESERPALAAVYRFSIDTHAKKGATSSGSPNSAKRS
jgi:hypothetical protein